VSRGARAPDASPSTCLWTPKAPCKMPDSRFARRKGSPPNVAARRWFSPRARRLRRPAGPRRYLCSVHRLTRRAVGHSAVAVALGIGRTRKRATGERRTAPGACFMGEQQSASATECSTSCASGPGACFHANSQASLADRARRKRQWPSVQQARARSSLGPRSALCLVPDGARAPTRAGVAGLVRLGKRSSPGSAPTSWLLRTNSGHLSETIDVAAITDSRSGPSVRSDAWSRSRTAPLGVGATCMTDCHASWAARAASLLAAWPRRGLGAGARRGGVLVSAGRVRRGARR
jgi:hypothetical protein